MLHRPEHAQKDHKKMESINEDAIITSLAGAWVNLALVGLQRRECREARTVRAI